MKKREEQISAVNYSADISVKKAEQLMSTLDGSKFIVPVTRIISIDLKHEGQKFIDSDGSIEKAHEIREIIKRVTPNLEILRKEVDALSAFLNNLSKEAIDYILDEEERVKGKKYTQPKGFIMTLHGIFDEISLDDPRPLGGIEKGSFVVNTSDDRGPIFYVPEEQLIEEDKTIFAHTFPCTDGHHTHKYVSVQKIENPRPEWRDMVTGESKEVLLKTITKGVKLSVTRSIYQLAGDCFIVLATDKEGLVYYMPLELEREDKKSIYARSLGGTKYIASDQTLVYEIENPPQKWRDRVEKVKEA